MRAIDHTGKKYNHLTLLVRLGIPRIAAKGKTLWSAICDCGNKCDVCSREVSQGKVKTCGKCEIHRTLVRTKSRGTELRNWVRMLYSRDCREGVRRGLTWELTPEQYKDMINKSCFLCGKAPSHRVASTKRYYTPLSLVNPALGYSMTNCIPSCTECARLRKGYNLIDFIDLANKMITYVTTRAVEND